MVHLLAFPALLAAETPVITLDLGQPGVKVSPLLYGLMTEEINHSYDGGLYAELIQNRIFQDDTQQPVHWSLVQAADRTASFSLDQSQPVENTILTTCLKLDATQARGQDRVGIANDGYWGIPVKPNTTYRASFYAKTDALSGPLTVDIESNDGTTVYAQAQVPKLTGQWQKYQVTLTTLETAGPSTPNRFVISTKTPGTFWFNLVSLFPPTYNNRPNGNRIDLMQMLLDLKPAFLRFPGGDFLEGHTLAERFAFKTTLHDVSQRPSKMGRWHYPVTDGMGLLEFLEWCEDLKMQPLLAVFAGYTTDKNHIAAGPDLQPYVQDALDEIEYVTGDASTPWGAQRAADGHPTPFPLTYVEIGNEDFYDHSGSYEERFPPFFDAIRAKYPNLQIIATTPVKSRQPDIVDDHYYRPAGKIEDMVHQYDNVSRNGVGIFVGEWATREGGPTGNLNGALGDAAWMTGLERNSDLVKMSCYAPLLVNINHGAVQWTPNLIGYDALTSFGGPSYYALKVFSNYLGDRTVPVTSTTQPMQTWQPPTPKAKPNEPLPTTPAPMQIPSLFFSATKSSEKGTIYLKLVNAASVEQPVQIDLDGVTNVIPDGLAVVLTSLDPKDTNSITQPTKIVPAISKISGLGKSFTRILPPYSINVLQIETR